MWNQEKPQATGSVSYKKTNGDFPEFKGPQREHRGPQGPTCGLRVVWEAL